MKESKKNSILRALARLEEELINEAPRKKGLRRNRKPQDGEIDTTNIIDAERAKSIPWQLPDYDKPIPESPEKKNDEKKREQIKK